MESEAILHKPEYDFIHNENHLGDRILLLERNPNVCELLGLDEDQYRIRFASGHLTQIGKIC